MNSFFEEIIEKVVKEPRTSAEALLGLKEEESPLFFGFCAAKNLQLETWNAIAIGLYDLKRTKEFLELMHFLINEQMTKPCYNDESFASGKVNIVNTLSVYYLTLAANETEIKQKNEHFSQVLITFNKSDKIKIEESSLFALKGYMLFFKGEYSKALDYFNNSNCVACILGTAILEFSSKNYEESLKLFKTALKMNPKMPANARLGIAYNFFFLEKYNMAYFTFQRILKLDPQNVDALLGLAVLEFKNENYTKYHEVLEKAYKLDKASPLLLLHIAEFFLMRNDLEKAFLFINFNIYSCDFKAKVTAIKGHKLLRNCPKFLIDSNSQLTERRKRRNDFYEIKSRFLYILGFYYHCKNKYDQAMKYYEDAVQTFPMNLSAQYSLGQVCISQKNFTKALRCFEIVNENSKDQNEECLKILGYLYLKNSKRNEAIEYYQKSLKFDPNDFETWIEYASLQEHYDPKVSLEAYEKALEVMSQRNPEEIKPELLNNIGVLKMKMEKYEESQAAFQKAFEICLRSDESRLENGHCKYLINTIQFNMGILFEEMKKLRDSNEKFKAIISQNPFYIDAYLRLSYLALKRGSSVKALDYCKQAIDKIEHSKKIRPDLAICLKGFIFQEIGDTTNARQAYESVKKKYNLEDPFADFSIMRIMYEESCEFRDQSSEQSQAKKLYTIEKFLKILIEQSKAILTFDEFNYQAASIVAIVMAELGHFREAKEIFNQIEYNQQNVNMLVNVAHLEYLKGNYENAIKIYSSYLQKSQAPDEFIEMCIVINYFLLKKNDEALKFMKKLILRNPESFSHRYNLSVLLHEFAQQVLEQKDRRKEQTEKSIELLRIIQPFFEYFFRNNYARKSRDDLEKCDDSRRRNKRVMERIREASENKMNFIQNHQQKFEEVLKEDEDLMKRKLLSVEEKKRRIQEMKERELMKKAEKEREEEEKMRKYEELALEQMRNAEIIAESLRNQESEKPKKRAGAGAGKRKAKKGKKKGEEEFLENPEEEEEFQEEVSVPREEDDDFNEFDVNEENEPEAEKEPIEEKDELDEAEEKMEKMEEERRNKRNRKRKFKEEEDEVATKEENKGRKKKKLNKHFGEKEEEGIFHDQESPLKERGEENDEDKGDEEENHL